MYTGVELYAKYQDCHVEIADSTPSATRFQVPSAFLLQQAAWIYERHLDHVRTQMKKVGNANAPGTASFGSAHTTIGGVPMQRGGSGGSRSAYDFSTLTAFLMQRSF